MNFSEKLKIIIPACIIVLLLFIFSTGCTNKTIDTTATVFIDNTGNVSKYSLTSTMSESDYLAIKNKAAANGYSSVREYFLRDFQGNSDYFEYDEPKMDSGKKIIFTSVRTIDSSHTIKSISLRKENNQVFFNDSTFSSEYFFPRSSIKKLDYTINSDIKVRNHNANDQSKDHFEISWIFKEDDKIPTLYMVTEPIGDATVKSPGFDNFLAMLALCVISYILFIRRD